MNSSITDYLAEVNEFSMLSREEEINFATLAKNGDEEARNKLVEANLRLPMAIAKHYIGCGLEYADLVQEGNLGLIEASKKFDVEKGWKFSTYATYWIRHTITRALANKSRDIRIPTDMYDNLQRLRKTIRELTVEYGYEPDNSEIAERMNMKEEEVKELSSYLLDTSSLDVRLKEDDDATFGSLIEDTSQPTAFDTVWESEKSKVVDDVLDSLSEREANIIRYRFGLFGGEPMTLEEIGKIYNLTKERVRQLENAALRKLRHPVRAKILSEVY